MESRAADPMVEMRASYKRELEAFYGVAADSLSDEKVKVWFGLAMGVAAPVDGPESDQGAPKDAVEQIEIDVTPAWFTPAAGGAAAVRRDVVHALMSKWSESGDRFAALMKEHKTPYAPEGYAHPERFLRVAVLDDRVLVRAPRNLEAVVRPWAAALLDRLSDPEIGREAAEFAALTAGEGERSDCVLPDGRTGVLTTRAGFDDALFEWTDDRGQARRTMVSLPGIEAEKQWRAKKPVKTTMVLLHPPAVPFAGMASVPSLEPGDRILVACQPDAALNGVWLVSDGLWSRATDAHP